jgi:hypothetical protein
MARRKQPPIHHQNADLAISTEEVSPSSSPNGAAVGSATLSARWNGNVKGGGEEHRSNGPAPKGGSKLEKEKEKQAGLLELVVCIGGIYASLYVMSRPISLSWQKENTS